MTPNSGMSTNKEPTRMGTLTDDEDEDLVAAVPATEGAEVELEDEGTHSEPEVEVVEDDGRAQDGDERLSQRRR